MKMPGFTAEVCLHKLNGSYTTGLMSSESTEMAHVLPTTSMSRVQSFGFGRFEREPTLPSCRWELEWYECGSSLPGSPPIMCSRWVYCCTWPNGSKACM
jgi:hypothetical protein